MLLLRQKGAHWEKLMAQSKDNFPGSAFCVHTFLWKGRFVFPPALLAAYLFLFFLRTRWQSCFACFVQDHEFLLGTGSSHQILLSRLQKRSEFHIKTRGTFGEVLCENQAAGRIKKKKKMRGRAQALSCFKENTGFSASTFADRFRFFGDFSHKTETCSALRATVYPFLLHTLLH